MGARRLARLAAPLALAAAGCGPSAPTAFVAESTADFHVVHLGWQGPCDHQCDLEAHSAGQLLAARTAPAGAEAFEFELPSSVGEMTSIAFRLRDVDSDDRHSPWVDIAYLATLYPPAVWLLSEGMSGGQPWIGFEWVQQSTLAEGTRLERYVFSPFDDPAHRALWEDVPLPPGATSYLEPRSSEWIDGAVFHYRLRNFAGGVESHAATVSTGSGPPAAPASLTAAVEGSSVRLSWTNRSRVATSISIRALDDARSWEPVASLPPLADYWVETGLPPGFHFYGVEAVYDLAQFLGESGYAFAGALVPDPALDPAFAQGTVVLPHAEAAARAPAGDWALGSGLSSLGFWSAVLQAPEAGSWVAFQAAPNRYLAHPGPLVDPSGRVHAFLAPANVAPELSTGPIVHLWREGGAWHEEQIGYAVSLLPDQFWAAAAPDGSLHVLWRSEPGIPVASYAIGRGGTWSVEQVPGSALPEQDVGHPLAVDAAGNAAVILPVPAGATPAFRLLRRAGTGWTAEPIPDDPAVTAPSTLGLLAASGDRALWIQGCSALTSGLGDVCLRERTAAGWGASTLLAQGAAVYLGVPAAVSSDGARAALALGSSPVQLFLVEGGSTQTWLLPSPYGGSAVGFDGAGKAWVLSGLGSYGGDKSICTLYQER